jgi:hypothetical protein
MDFELKRALGKILGEVYRTQKRVDPERCGADDATIYGLLQGIEPVIDEELFAEDGVPRERYEKFVQALNHFFNDRERLKNLKGYYDIEDKLGGVESGRGFRGDAISLLTYFKAARKFEDLIEKLDTENSPGECRTFDLDEGDV